jgi:hypothetical protein
MLCIKLLNSFKIITIFSKYKFREIPRFNQYCHNLLQTIENQTRPFPEYKELLRFKEESRKSLHIDKGKIILCTIHCYGFYFLVWISRNLYLLNIVIILKEFSNLMQSICNLYQYVNFSSILLWTWAILCILERDGFDFQ